MRRYSVDESVMRIATSAIPAVISLLALGGCKDKELDASDRPGAGEACVPDVDGADHAGCDGDLVCQPTTEGAHVCAGSIELRGSVVDALTDAAIPGALVAALDATGAPVGDAVETDAEGAYVLKIVGLRNPDGSLADAAAWTLFGAAADYAIFPGGIRPAIPIDARDATAAQVEDVAVIENATTTIGLIPLPDEARGGKTVTGTVGGEEPGGTLVVAEGGPVPAPYTIADQSGHYVLFNVSSSATEIRGYRVGLELEPAAIGSAAVDLRVLDEDPAALAAVTGSVNIVNAQGGSATSVVLVPTSVFDPTFERGPVPLGLRAPAPPDAPSISGAFTIPGVPSGQYQVLAAFENDGLVRDPDMNIAGTAIQMVSVGDSGTAAVAASFKITGALEVIGPGADNPETVTTAPMLRWADDSSEDRYEVVVFDALGNEVWKDDNVPGESGNAVVETPYGGPALTAGMAYQFRATSFRDQGGGSTAIARTEDLRGVFVFAPAGP